MRKICLTPLEDKNNEIHKLGKITIIHIETTINSKRSINGKRILLIMLTNGQIFTSNSFELKNNIEKMVMIKTRNVVNHTAS